MAMNDRLPQIMQLRKHTFTYLSDQTYDFTNSPEHPSNYQQNPSNHPHTCSLESGRQVTHIQWHVSF